MKNLEDSINGHYNLSTNESNPEPLEDKTLNAQHRSSWITSAKNYCIDTTAGWMFYTPLMAASEYLIAGMEGEKVLRSRIYAAGVHALVMRPFGKFREWWAKKWKTDETSSWKRKLFVDTSANVMFQVPVYSAILYHSGATIKEIAYALPVGLLIGTLSGRPYGYFLDKCRKVFGAKATLS